MERFYMIILQKSNNISGEVEKQIKIFKEHYTGSTYIFKEKVTTESKQPGTNAFPDKF